MSAWCPKTSKIGSIPNISYEPRKPIPLVTMLNNGVEFISGVLTFKYIVQEPKKQQQKTYFGEKSFLSGDKKYHHTYLRYCVR